MIGFLLGLRGEMSNGDTGAFFGETDSERFGVVTLLVGFLRGLDVELLGLALLLDLEGVVEKTSLSASLLSVSGFEKADPAESESASVEDARGRLTMVRLRVGVVDEADDDEGPEGPEGAL